jgi:hypothetical protein
MAFQRGIDGSEPVAREPIGRLAETHESRRVARSRRLAIGTLACPACDAPVLPMPGAMSPSDPLGCGFCLRAGAVRDFLSLAAPTRPTRVELRVIRRAPSDSPAGSGRR